MIKDTRTTNKYYAILQLAIILAILAATRVHSYDLFHSVTEIVCVILAVIIFGVVWNARGFLENNYFLLIGLAFLFASGMILAHAFSYNGINIIYPLGDTNIATQLWVASRYLIAASFFAAPFFINKKLNDKLVFSLYLIITALLFLSIFYWHNFPAAYVPGQGLTKFKINSEVVISVLSLFGLLLLNRHKNKFNNNVYLLISLAIGTFILSEFFFTLYKTPFATFNLLGHFCEVISLYLLYLGIAQIALMKPYDLLFKNLNESRQALDYLASYPKLNPYPVMELDYLGNITYINPVSEKIYPDMREKGKKHPFLSEFDKVMMFYNQNKNNKFTLEKQVGEKWFQQQFYCLRKERRIRLYSLEITQRIKAKIEQRNAQNYLENLINNANAPIIVWNTLNEIQLFNIALEHLTGYTANDVLNKKLDMLFPPVSLIDSKLKIKRALSENWKTVEIPILCKNKEIRTILWNIANIYENPRGVLISTIAQGNDITERILSEKLLKKQTKRLQIISNDLKKFKLAVENASDMIVITDLEAKIVYANKAVLETTGYSPEEIRGKRPAIWGKIMDSKFYQELWETIKIKKMTFSREITNRKKNGEHFIADLHISPIMDENDNVIFFIGIQRDITKAKQIDQAKDEFISLASHQLRTPLANLSLSAELLLRGIAGPLEEKQKYYIDGIYKSSIGMANLVGALLNLSRIELGKFHINPEPFNIIDEANRITAEFKPQINNKGMTFDIILPSHFPVINFDKNVFRIVIENLISNAIKYSPAGGKISIKFENEQNNLLLTVSDTGYGIPKEDQDKIYQKSYRSKTAIKMDTEGMGLGLYIIKYLLNLTSGKIWFESEDGKGTTFHVSIPLN